MVVGVNGVGKTTTIGKIAHRHREQGRSVLLGAADTFRAAAIEQLDIWAQRAGVEVIKQSHGSDPAAVAFDTMTAAASRGSDVVIVDTAGRLHTKGGLMEELSKIKRVMGRHVSGAPHEVLLVLDASTGQNAIRQAEEFTRSVDVTGLVLTKLDGTAKGGIVIGISHEFGVPVKYIGVGERIEDLQVFDRQRFVSALFGS
jgi:fused signal recognition particle receptor